MAKGFKKPLRKKPLYRKTPVVWGVPCDELGYSKFWVRFVASSGIMPFDQLASPESTYLEKARNDIHNAFLKSEYPYLMMLDSDILFPPKLLEHLMAHNLPIVGGWYKDKKSEDKHPCAYDFVEDKPEYSVFRHRNEPGTGVEKISALGAGCWLMKREVAVALGENPYGHNIAGGGEDFILCRKLMKLDIPLHVDWAINCAHLGVGYY